MGHFRKRLITLLMTERCNLACRYCFLGSTPQEGPGRTLDLKFAKLGIDDFFAANPPAIRFFGSGEPTMAFEAIQELWRYAKDKADAMGEPLFSELQTNGYFNEAACEWIGRHLSMVWVSCDGPPDIQDAMRPTASNHPSSEVVERNIRALVKGGCRVGVRATIGSANLHRQKDMVDYFAGLGVEAIFADHICLALEDGQPPQEGLGQVSPMDYAREFLKARAYAEAKGVFYSNFLVVNFDEPVAIACRQGIPVPHLTPSGYVSSCDMAVDKTGTPMDALLYGVYRPRFGRIDYDQAAIERIRSRAVGALEACRDCPVEGYCAGGCAGEAINETGDFYGVKQNLCEATKFLAEALGVNHPRPYPYLHP